MSLSESVSSGRIASLEALRDRLAREIDGCESSRDVAALSNRFQDVLREIDELRPPVVEKPSTPLDELRARRETARKTG